MLRILLLSGALILASWQAAAQSKFLSSPEEVRRTTQGIVAGVAAGKYAPAMKELRAIFVIPAAEFDQFEAEFKTQTTRLIQRMGRPMDYEAVRESTFGARLLRQEFLVYHERGAQRWVFIFYSAAKGWALTELNFETDALAYFPK